MLGAGGAGLEIFSKAFVWRVHTEQKRIEQRASEQMRVKVKEDN